MRFLISFFILFSIPHIGFSATIQVPGDQSTIQDGIDAAVTGDTVLVGPGTFYEKIDFKGKKITVKSSDGAAATVIDGTRSGSVVTFNSIEGLSSVLDGFTLTNGSGRADFEGKISGGGIYCESSSPTIINNIITDNQVIGSGGGAQMTSSKSLMGNNIIVGNMAGEMGGGIDCNHSLLVVTNNIIAGNTANRGGALGFRIHSSPTVLVNNTITGNLATGANGQGGALYFTSVSSPTIKNTILWGNDATAGSEIFINSGTPKITYCIVQGDWAGVGNIDQDPRFTDSQYHIDSNSPCIDQGDNSAPSLPPFDYEGDDRIFNGVVDIGADESTYALAVDKSELSEITGGTAGFSLAAGAANGNRNYLVFATVSGTSPGTPLPGGMAVLPVNWDFFTSLALAYVNSPVFQDFMGTLDSEGAGAASFFLSPVPGAAGLILNFAYALNAPWDFASNPVTVEIVP